MKLVKFLVILLSFTGYRLPECSKGFTLTGSIDQIHFIKYGGSFRMEHF